MKKFLSLLILALFLLLPVAANAVTIINDEYFGADDHTSGDVIGNDSAFGISKMEVDYSGGILTVDIYSRYLDNIVNNSGTLGTELTDLFISTNGWNPFGSAPYLDDDWSNGEIWEYALVMDDYTPTGVTDGNIGLYQIPYDDTNRGPASSYGQAIEISDEIFGSGTYRNGQEVRLDTTGLTSLKAGTWEISWGATSSDEDNFIRFIVDYDFQATDPLAFHYASATCANEVIEGQVPEPATLLLSGLGLLGMGCFFRRKIKKA